MPNRRKSRKGVPPEPFLTDAAARPPAKAERTMTYRVGWKSGSIRLSHEEAERLRTAAEERAALGGAALPKAAKPGDDRDRHPPQISALQAAAPQRRPYGRLAALFLHPAPQPTMLGWKIALPVLVAAGFAAVLWLANRLGP